MKISERIKEEIKDTTESASVMCATGAGCALMIIACIVGFAIPIAIISFVVKLVMAL